MNFVEKPSIGGSALRYGKKTFFGSTTNVDPENDMLRFGMKKVNLERKPTSDYVI